MTTKSILTASRINTHLTCQRKHYWRYEVGMASTVASEPLRFGRAWHLAMATRWKGGAQFDAFMSALPPDTDELDPLAVATLGGMLEGYFAYYGNDDALVREMHPEVQFNLDLNGSRTFELAGVIDGLGVLGDGRPVIIESKTAGEDISPESDYWMRLKFNPQLLQYVLAARELGWDIETIVYDVARKPSIAPKQIPLLDPDGLKIVLDGAGNRVYGKNGKPRQSGDKDQGYELQSREETPEEFGDRLAADTKVRPEFYFARREVPVLDDDLEEFRVQRLVTARQILGCRAEEKRHARPERGWPRNISMFTCRNCEFASFCLQNVSVNINQPPAGFRVGNPHEELT
jgi:hypothetical protein